MDVKWVVNITSAPLKGALEDDDLRGEGRWERLITRGLLRTGDPVGATRDVWGGDSGTPYWLGHVTNLSDCALVTIYGSLACAPDGAGLYLLQFFSVMNEPIANEIRGLMARNGRGRVFITHSYPSDGCDEVPGDLRDRVALLPVPVGDVMGGDATQRTVHFSPSRNTMHDLFADGGAMLDFVRRALERDPRLSFEAVSGPYESNGRQAILDHPLMRCLDGVRNRVAVHPPLTGAEVQVIYARTRLVVVPCGYGGPPIESARHGIPVIAQERDCSLFSAKCTPGFPELPRVGPDGSLVSILERLLYDTDYARRVGDAGRRYVSEHYSQVAFGQATQDILRRIT